MLSNRLRPFHIVSFSFGVLLLLLLWAYFEELLSGWWFLAWFLAYTFPLVLGAIFIQWNFYLKSYNRSAPSKLLALTFDDGPAKETAAILDILKNEKISAAFFCIGKHAAQHPGLVKRWHAEGHLTANHSYHHGFNFDWQSASKMADEIEETNRLLKEITGQKPKLFRPPYGVTNPNLARAVRITGMQSVGWNIRSFDTTANDPQQLLARILNKLQGGDIILLHDSMEITREILTQLIHSAQQKGFTFVRVDKMPGLNASA